MDNYYLKHIEELTREDFDKPELFQELFALSTNSERQLYINKLSERARDLKIKTYFQESLRAYKTDLKHLNTTDKESYTSFSILDNTSRLPAKIAEDMKHIPGQLKCGSWICDDNGIRIFTDKGEIEVCSHPIFPVKVLRNIESGTYKVELVYDWQGVKSIFVPREALASTTKIVELAKYGVLVKARSNGWFSEYFTDMEKLNPEIIRVFASTSKLGWVEDGKTICFIPYHKDIVYDNETNFKTLYESIRPSGSKDDWYECVKAIRAKRQPEVLLNLAASFASALIHIVNTLPFIVSLWGRTGIGKSVLLKLCASVWGDPGEGKFITDAKSTPVAMEIRQNVLNSLPMLIDDMAQLNRQNNGDYSDLIYKWCAVGGRSRGTKNMTLQAETHWENCVITNGERSMVDETTQGGAINRVIDIESSGEFLFDGEDGRDTVKTISKNFGWAGEDFINVVMQLGAETINKMFNESYKAIRDAAKEKGVEKEEKQVMPMALMLLADEIIETHLFNDGIRVDIQQAISYLRDKGEISETKAAYRNLMDVVMANSSRFANEPADMDQIRGIECWGCYLKKDREYVAILPTYLKNLLDAPGLQKAFISWANKEGILMHDKTKNTKTLKVGEKAVRFYVINTTYGIDEEEEEEALQEELPFK